jgi:hypothetical protein
MVSATDYTGVLVVGLIAYALALLFALLAARHRSNIPQ